MSTRRVQPAPGVRIDPPSRDRMDFLDGLRGLAALYVTFHHATIAVPPEMLGPRTLQFLPLFYMGHSAVSVFIVLSGYCLMLPVVRSADGRLRGGFGAYLRRRGRRILPPYYAAFGLCLILAATVPDLRGRGGTFWDLALPIFRLDVIASHLTLVHNLRMRWFFRVDPPLWSVATEWQIYFLFPALLWIWRRHGVAPAVVAGFTFGVGLPLIPQLFTAKPDLAWTLLCPWYVGLFALGMAAAVVGSSDDFRARWCKDRLPWSALTVGFAALGFIRLRNFPTEVFPNDAVVGLATACLIVDCVIRERRGMPEARHPLLRILNSRTAVALGAFSYSLYLLNYPLLSLAYLLARKWILAPEARLAFSMLVAAPITVAMAYAFHLVFERPFMTAAPVGEGRAPLRFGRRRREGSPTDAVKG